MDASTLVSFGLSRREAEVYYALLQVEDAPASDVCEKTNESRTNTYDTLNSLIKKGLVGYVVKNNTKHFLATDPKKLLDWIDHRKTELDDERKTIEQLIPDLRKLKLPTKKNVTVEVYEGKEGLRTMLQETLESTGRGGTLLIFGAIAHKLRELDPIYHKQYFVRRKHMRIKTRYVFIEGENPPRSELAEYRFLPKQFHSFAATAIHGDEVSFWLMTTPAVVILVKSKELAATYRSNFEAIWRLAKK